MAEIWKKNCKKKKNYCSTLRQHDGAWFNTFLGGRLSGGGQGEKLLAEFRCLIVTPLILYNVQNIVIFVEGFYRGGYISWRVYIVRGIYREGYVMWGIYREGYRSWRVYIVRGIYREGCHEWYISWGVCHEGYISWGVYIVKGVYREGYILWRLSWGVYIVRGIYREGYISWAVYIVKLSFVRSYPLPCYFLAVRARYLPNHPVLEHPQPLFFP